VKASPSRYARDGQRYPRAVEGAIYFCCAEALQTAVKHAAASHVSVTVETDQDQVRFEVHDNGRRLPGRALNDGTGVQHIRDRIEALGGQTAFLSTPGQGTILHGCPPSSTVEAAATHPFFTVRPFTLPRVAVWIDERCQLPRTADAAGGQQASDRRRLEEPAGAICGHSRLTSASSHQGWRSSAGQFFLDEPDNLVGIIGCKRWFHTSAKVQDNHSTFTGSGHIKRHPVVGTRRAPQTALPESQPIGRNSIRRI